jgi:hypothetical protein
MNESQLVKSITYIRLKVLRVDYCELTRVNITCLFFLFFRTYPVKTTLIRFNLKSKLNKESRVEIF